MTKLTWFQVRGGVEFARLMLEFAGTPYEIESISAETWIGPDGKEHYLKCTPYGQPKRTTETQSNAGTS